ncbi:NAD(P)/FAD-dependent oxidoreductase [Burkholderia sp. BCCIQ04A]|uniref:NAD(P)/FAD-dependent oxidoreductase n=1 Tax=Burkholderia anthinoferrum TaxID=3090833 RepID=A0ABU5WQG4_9BURK|nr:MULTISPECIES: NAD(P)/FAD-dependent oxidoreductase [Burkholderia]MEB2504281.1 NAD(P)/FAD-dependent oxidoreductase [Burkholderia anthinoferrum]MEB2531407.1 NAD(P)/FAD-dependent oxidoreductase [Burkholderia anthinoferrum]MEB2561320.1 NAD(P)/FAD-dependent oxidoreductase [Burkholderia anthinoferrum]MEB2581031.1 NAD(P)/FAD-dependent oxidoreductase [Burkholderia anthinoferrum]MDF3088971.1 NAD(P)/FAD-dependent oxidoreductase [Burkholderia semiarida]
MLAERIVQTPSIERPAAPAPDRARYRVAVIGGGPAGSSCALALARAGIADILLVEAGSYADARIGESIPPESRILFRRLGIDAAFVAQAHEPCYGSCSYWGSDKRGYNDSVLSPHGHGWHLDRRRFDAFLASQARAAGAELLTGHTLLASAPHAPSGHTLSLGRATHVASRVQADFVVDASGARAAFARQRGATRLDANPLICIAARLARPDTGAPASMLTHLEAVEHGWWYLASVPGRMVVVMFATHAPAVRTMRLYRAESWRRMLQAARRTWQLVCDLGLDLSDLRVKSYPAPSHHLDRLYGDNWLAIGDAASAYDPITAQGIVKSISNGIAAAETIRKHMDGDPHALEAFARMVDAQYRRYLQMRHHFYGLEQRWPAADFWRQCTEASSLA